MSRAFFVDRFNEALPNLQAEAAHHLGIVLLPNPANSIERRGREVYLAARPACKPQLRGLHTGGTAHGTGAEKCVASFLDAGWWRSSSFTASNGRSKKHGTRSRCHRPAGNRPQPTGDYSPPPPSVPLAGGRFCWNPRNNRAAFNLPSFKTWPDRRCVPFI